MNRTVHHYPRCVAVTNEPSRGKALGRSWVGFLWKNDVLVSPPGLFSVGGRTRSIYSFDERRL
jgi:hypothetical protein